LALGWAARSGVGSLVDDALRLPSAPSNDGPQVVAGNQSAPATIQEPQFLNFAGPAVVAYQPPNSPQAGRVVYTTFHNDEQADALMQKILNYLVFLL
jgi:hypothetical protein